MAMGGDRSDIEFLPLKVQFGGFFSFPARFGKFTEPCLLGLNWTPYRYKHKLDCLTS